MLLVALSIPSFAVKAEDSITVKPGQSIIKIMRQVYPDQRSQWPALMRELVQLNPSAFESDDPRTLKAGAVIVLPLESTAKVKKVKRIRAASVKSITGSVTLFNDKKKAVAIKARTNVYVGDQLLTAGSGAVTLSFIDGATVKLRCNSLLNIDQYKMRTRGSLSELSLLKGSLHNETGRIGKRGHDKAILKTPLGTVTVNQAEYGVRVHQAQACAQQADVENDGLFVAVLSGEAIVENGAGELAVASGDAAMVAQRGVSPASVQTFSGMVFGDKVIEKVVPVKSQLIERVKKSEEPAITEENGIPIWWSIAAVLILGVSF